MADDLLVDLRSVARKPVADELASWASEQRAFVSSVMAELSRERVAVAEALRDFGIEPVWFEEFGGRDDDPEAAYLAEVASSSIYIGLLGREYGRILKSRLSATHTEYRKAELSGLRICVWTKAGADHTADQMKFLQEIQTFHVTNSFTSAQGLAEAVCSRMAKIAAEDLTPWLKLGHVIIRASAIHETSSEVIVSAIVHDPTVVAALEAMRPTFWSDDIRKVTYAGRSKYLQLKRIETTVTTTRTTKVEIGLVPAMSVDDKPLSFSLTGADYSIDDVVEINLSKALFGTPGPRGLAIIGGTIKDPLEAVRRLRPPEEIVRPLIALLISEAIVASGQAARVIRVGLSQSFDGRRQILVEWQPRGSKNRPRSVEGHVQL